MIKNKSHVEVERGEKRYTFICDNDSPLGEIHDVLCEIKDVIIEKIQEHALREKQSPEEKGNDNQ